MKSLRYPLIITDFDGTLLRSDLTVAEETRKSIESFVEAGGIFVISTGRSYASISQIARSLGLKGLASSFHGNVIGNVETDEIILDGGLTAEEAYEIALAFEASPKGNSHLLVYTAKNFYTTKVDEFFTFYEKITWTKGIVLEEKASEFIKKNNLRVKKILAYVDPSERDFLYNFLKERLEPKYYVSYSDKTLVEVSSKNYNKGTALAFLAKHYGVDESKTIAVGDSMNDLPMLQRAGKGIAVKNADETVKSLVGAFEYSNNENAIGKIIEKYAFME